MSRLSGLLAPVSLIISLTACGGGGSGSNFVPGGTVTPPSPPVQQVALTRLSTDTFTNAASQHASEVEPHAFANGSTIVSAFQVGRIFAGGGAAIGFATSTNGGATWTTGFLPGLTVAVGSGPFSAASDAVVAYDAKHATWLISTLAITSSDRVVVSRSNDGLTWQNPITVSTTPTSDKNWIVCDNTATSPHFGTCYMEWDDPSQAGLVFMSTSTDGGLTWSAAVNTVDQSKGIGGIPLVQPNGNVIVPIASFATQANPVANQMAFRSTDGGSTWGTVTIISPISDHAQAGSLRSSPLPTAQVDAAGNVYVAWHDCRFRTSCASNDIVMSTSPDGLTWTTPVRIPLDTTSSTIDHFIPALAIDPATSGSAARLALLYYSYPVSSCTTDTCSLNAAIVTSQDGGSSWSSPTTLVSGMSLNSLPNTSSGRMVGDYFANVFSNGKALPIFTLANLPTGTTLDQAIYAATTGFNAMAANHIFVSRAQKAKPNAKSDHAPSGYFDLDREYPQRPPQLRKMLKRK
jgi:hypothetical protein